METVFYVCRQDVSDRRAEVMKYAKDKDYKKQVHCVLPGQSIAVVFCAVVYLLTCYRFSSCCTGIVVMALTATHVKVDDERRKRKPKKEDPGLRGIIIPLPPFGDSEMDGGVSTLPRCMRKCTL